MNNQNKSYSEFFFKIPTLFWFTGLDIGMIQSFALIGMTLSLIVIISGKSNKVIMFILWIFFLSLLNVLQNSH